MLMLALALTFIVARAGRSRPSETTTIADDESVQVSNLVAMIEYSLDESNPGSSGKAFGAGIIFAVGSDSLYIFTAFHVVRAAAEKGQPVQVQFNWMRGTWFEAALERHVDRSLDLAVLRVGGLNKLKVDFDALPFDRVGDVDSLKLRAELNTIGYPNSAAWRINASPHRMSEKKDARLYFESASISQGNSGGPLLNEQFEIVGMVSSDDPPEYWAIDIGSLLSRLKSWQYPVALGSSLIPTTFALVAANDDRTCALSESGRIYCWGIKEIVITKNRAGQPLRREVLYASEPVRDFSSNLKFRSLILGKDGRALGLTTDGSAYFWHGRAGTGIQDYGAPVQLGGGLKFVALSLGFNLCGITTEHDAVCWNVDGSARQSAPSPLGIKLTSISSGAGHSCGVSPAGGAYCWGSNYVGELGNGTTQASEKPVPVSGNAEFKSVGTGLSFSCGLTREGDVYCWGSYPGLNWPGAQNSRDKKPVSDSRLPTLVAGKLKFKSISVGETHVCGLTDNGEGYCWGVNISGKLGNGSTSNSKEPTRVSGGQTFKDLSVGKLHTCGLTAEGLVYCWGAYHGAGSPKASGAGESGVAHSFGWTPSLVPNRLLPATIYKLKSLIFEGQYQQALGEVKVALRLYPNERDLREMHAFLLADLGHSDQAVAEGRQLVVNQPEQQQLLFLARLYLRAANHAGAAAMLQSAQRIATAESEQEDLYLLSAGVFRAQNSYEAEEAALRKLLTLKPKSVRALNRLSYLLADRNVDLDEALILIERAVQSEPDNPELLATRGWVRYRQGDTSKAVSDLQQAWETGNPNPALAEHLGDAYLKNGEPQAAINQWRRALSEWEKIPPLRQETSVIARIKEKIAKSATSAPGLVRQFPTF